MLGFEAVIVTFPLVNAPELGNHWDYLFFFLVAPKANLSSGMGNIWGKSMNIMQLRVFHCGERGCQTVYTCIYLIVKSMGFEAAWFWVETLILK